MNIGYYAHHHGSGHCRQADKLAQYHKGLNALSAKSCMTVFTSMPKVDYSFFHIDKEHVVRLPSEHESDEDVLLGRAGEYWQPECLHYSPVGNRNIQKRSHIILSEVHARHIELMIVDLSVEVALLCRTASVPYLYMRLHGNRNDTPHRNAFAGALALLAPYPKALESKDTPQWIKDKTFYMGFLPHHLTPISKHDFIQSLSHMLTKDNENLERQSDNIETLKNTLHPNNTLNKGNGIKNIKEDNKDTPPIITVIKGFGGHQRIDSQLSTLRKMLPHAIIISLGPIGHDAKACVDLALTVDDVTPFLQHSNLLVMACGLNAIGEACQFDTPLLVLPDERPHQEQEKMADALIHCGRAMDLAQLKNQLANAHSELAFSKTPSAVVTELQSVNSHALVSSMATAQNVKSWFVNWLLPQLAIQPEKL